MFSKFNVSRSFEATIRYKSESENEPIRTRTDVLKNESNRTEPEPDFWKFSRTEPNSNRMISIQFVSMVVLSFEKSSYIPDQVLWFLLNESLGER